MGAHITIGASSPDLPTLFIGDNGVWITGSGSLTAVPTDGLRHREGLSAAWMIDRPH